MSRATTGRWFISLATRFLVAFIAGAVLPLVVFGIFQVTSSYSVQRAQVEELQHEAARNAANTIDTYLEQIEDEMTLTAREWSLQTDKSRTALLDSLLAYNVGFETLTLMDKTGQEVAKTSRYTLFGSEDLDSRAASPEFLVPMQGERYLGPTSISQYGEPLVTLAIPIKNVRGEIAGVLSAEVNLKHTWDIIAHMEIGRGGYAYVVNGEGRLIAHRDSSLVLQGRDLSGLEGVRSALQGQAVTDLYTGLEGQGVIGSYQALRQADWFILVEAPTREALANVYRAVIVNVAVIAATLALAVLLGWYMTRIVVQPLKRLQEGAAIIGGGDLTHRIDIQTRDEVGALASAFNAMTAQLQETIGTLKQRSDYLQATVQEYVEYMAEVGQGNLAVRLTLDGDRYEEDDPLVMLGHRLNETVASLQGMSIQIRNAANNLNEAAAEILAATTQQVSGANEQSAAISQTTTTVDEVKTISEQAIARAQEVVDASQRTVQVSRSGQQTVQNTIGNMAQIKARVEGIAETILALSEQTQQIGDIIATVNDLAAQSNILALNASVEAARAGEHGKGFAVVAIEVRNLAEQSKQATAQVKDILLDIQKGINTTVMATEEGTKVVDQGVQLTAQTREVIEQLSGVIDESAQTAMQVMAGGRQQASGVEQIALAMQNINQATMQSLSSTRQAEKAAQELNDLARTLTETVEQYQL